MHAYAHLRHRTPMTDSQYVWQPDSARRHDTSVVVFGHLSSRPDSLLAAKFFAERAEYSHEVGFYLSHIGGPHVPQVVATVAPLPLPAATPWGALVMERGDYSLAEWLSNPRMRKAAPEAVKRGALKDVADALSLLHASDVVHRDVRPANLVSGSPCVVLCGMLVGCVCKWGFQGVGFSGSGCASFCRLFAL